MKAIWFILLLFVTLNSHAQTYQPSIHLDKKNGLLQNTVWAIEEDQFYRIWIGSQEGLQFYDGFNLTTIPEIHESVTTLYHRDSTMYCLTLSMLYKIDESTLKIKSVKLNQTDYYTPEFSDSGFFLTTSNGTQTFHFDLELNPVHAISEKKAHLFQCEQKIGDFLIEGDHNGLTYDYQPTINNLPQGVVFQHITNPQKLTAQYCKQLLEYEKSRGFIATHNGLLEINSKEGVLHIQNHFENTRVEAILIDHNKNLWVGMAGNGVMMIHRNTLQSEYFVLPSVKNENIYAWDLMPVDSVIYVATNKGIQIIGNTSPSPLSIQQITKNIMCFSMIYTDNYILIGTGNKGILKYQNNKLTSIYNNPNEVLDNTIIQFIKNERGILANSKRSFIQFDKNGEFLFSKKFHFKNKNAYVMHIVITDYGYLVATTNGTYKLDSSFNIIQQSQSQHSVSMITSFQDEIWESTFDSGLINYSQNKILSNQLVTTSFLTLSNFKNQSLWSSSHSGIYKYEPPIIRPYDIENGFNISEYDQLSVHQDTNGYIYFGGIGGIVKFNPDKLNYFPSYPQVISKFRNALLTNNQIITLPFDQSEISLDITPIILTDKNYFTVEILYNDTIISVPKPEKIVVSVPFKNSNIKIRITDLVHHESQIIKYHLYRQIPFWKKTWFIMISLILLTLLVIGIFSFVGYLKTKKLLKKEQSDRKITEERLRISKELHDNIGARITHIISSLDVEMYHRKENNKTIETINTFARETMAQLRETIWAVSDKTVFFSEFTLRISQYVDQVNDMSVSNIVFSQNVNQDFELNPVQTINFYRIVQEAINNSVKYAKSKNISISVKESNQQISIQVTDDGQGFDLKSAANGTGLKGMQNRAKEAEGIVKITSNKGGTIISLTFGIGEMPY